MAVSGDVNLPELAREVKEVLEDKAIISSVGIFGNPHVHGKDATIAWDVIKSEGLRSGKPVVWHRTPGFGDTNWTDIITILRQASFRGAIDIEGWHDPVYKGDLEMTGQVHGLNYLKQCRGNAYVPNPK